MGSPVRRHLDVAASPSRPHDHCFPSHHYHFLLPLSITTFLLPPFYFRFSVRYRYLSITVDSISFPFPTIVPSLDPSLCFKLAEPRHSHCPF